MDKYVMDMTITELRNMEYKKPEGVFDAFVIVPMKSKHDSGYRNMKYILMNEHEIVGVVGGGSDVVHFNGFDGMGEDYKNRTRMKKAVSYSIDCLPKSGCVRVFVRFCKLEVQGHVLSDFVFNEVGYDD